MIMIEHANLDLGDLVAMRVDLDRLGIIIGVTQWIGGPADFTYTISFCGDRLEAYEAELVRVVRNGKTVNVSSMTDTEGVSSTPPDGCEDEE